MQVGKPRITINVQGEEPTQYNGGLKSYSTLDTIKGEVTIIATTADIRFDDVQVTFEGKQRTWMDRMGATPATSGRTSSTITFLKLTQPTDETLLPHPRILERGRKYIFPFTFVIPERLLPTACTHTLKNDSVRDSHLQLPPSAGDPSLATDQGCLADDLFPDMTLVSYYIQAKLVRRRESDGKAVSLGDTFRRVRILPIVEELPPVHIEDHPGEYVMRAEKDIKKGFFKGKMGRLIVEAEQPRSLRLSKDSLCPATTMVPVSLWFVPADEALEPPKLGSLTAKLKVLTFYSTSQLSYIPGPSSKNGDPSLGYYGESLLLSSRCMESAKWVKQPLAPGPATTYKTTVLVPVTAPKCKELVPSFTSCLMSRSYTLDLSISVQASTHTSPSVSLKLPLQVSHPATPSSPVLTVANPNIDEFFTPRSIAPPELEQNRSGLPGYSILSGREVPVRIPSPVGISPGCG
ncbi:uncharacterized protein H6S33_003532 [Morchella sextelata]|uniref:uncharacterized protein n=1 Tax=Morchella sextelata TaxID=1174677 RepID=UPI001D037C57|nr:uncharacterized protein H6S33_003532 [Morchella sextelata]KAH0606698.1 hypothetical protein H6S33_003532 [Morchella sextelata]